MRDFTMVGIGKISGGEFSTIKVEGVGTCSDNIKADQLLIEGVFNCSGDIDAGYIHCKGVANTKKNIRAEKIHVEGVINMTQGDKIEAAEITSDGIIKTKGEISADIINAEGCIEADEIVGDQIKIHSYFNRIRFMDFFKKADSKSKSTVRLIEATVIDLKGVTADTVNGRDITIGPECVIDNVDCSGILFIDNSAVVKNITGNYTQKC